MTMTARQQQAVASMIVRITEEYRCIVSIENDEVTVAEDHGPSAHAHHRGANLYARMLKAEATAKEYAAARSDPGPATPDRSNDHGG